MNCQRYDPDGVYADPSVNYLGPDQESIFISDMDMKAIKLRDEFSPNALLEKRQGFTWNVQKIKTYETECYYISKVHLIIDNLVDVTLK